MMEEETGKQGEGEEISLIDLVAVMWRRRVMILVITLAAAVLVTVFSVASLVLPKERSPLPNEYTPRALMLINNESSSSGGLTSALNSSGLGSLASLAGVRTGGTNYSDLAVYLAGTNTMLDAVVDEFGLIERYEIKKEPRAESRKALKKVLKAETDTDSGVLILSFTDTEAVFARAVVNYCVEYLGRWFDEMGLDKNKREKENLERNIESTYQDILALEQESLQLERTVASGRTGGIASIPIELSRIQLELSARRQVYTQLKIQYEVLKVAMASEKPVFQVLEYAEAPDQKSGPSRGMLCIIVTFAAGFFSVFLAFVLNAVENVRKDPAAMAKLGWKDGERGTGK